MDSFRAGVQYGDWHGTAAADNTDFKDRLHDYLEKGKLIRLEEFLIAVSLWVGEGSTHINAYLFEGASRYDDLVKQLDTIRGPIPVREVTVEMSLQEFLKSFKRFNVMLTAHNLPLADREYSSHE